MKSTIRVPIRLLPPSAALLKATRVGPTARRPFAVLLAAGAGDPQHIINVLPREPNAVPDLIGADGRVELGVRSRAQPPRRARPGRVEKQAARRDLGGRCETASRQTKKSKRR